MQSNPTPEAKSGFLNRTWSEWFSTLPVFLILILTLIIGTGEMIHGQLLRVGEKLYGDPATGVQYSFLRADSKAPSCERHPNIEAQVQQQMAAGSANDDPFADLFGPKDPEEVRQSLLAAQAVCEEKHQFYENTQSYIDNHPSVKVFRTIETGFFAIFHFGTENRTLFLVIMVAIAAITATLNKHHIGLRPAVTKVDYLVHDAAMMIGNGMLAFSAISYILSLSHSGVAVETKAAIINYLWAILFITITLISAYRLIRPSAPKKEGGSFGLALLAVPLYAWMAIITGTAFIFFMDYSVGQAIYVGFLTDYVAIFLALGLFIWVGMLLTQTRVMDLFLNILRPWNFSPETLTWLILIAAAIPTAYTGASGIFVVAAGALIYKEVWNSGARRQYALAVSAMSGTLGMVIRPCLLVVLIAMLDSKHVTSDELFSHGIYVFWFISFLFLGVSLIVAESKFRINSPKVAIPGMVRAIGPVIPYVIIAALVVLFYKYALNTEMNEFTAPMILPLILLAVVFFDKVRREPASAAMAYGQAAEDHEKMIQEHEQSSPYLRSHDSHGVERRSSFEAAIRFATSETVGHIGALIILMALSASVGGLVEKTEIVHLLPTHLDNIYISLLFIALLLAGIGMTTDPFGAVILVAASIAPVAFANGIHPIHFWMICLVAFELGYVTPPVALNHLLTRLSVGDEEVLAADAEAKAKYTKFYYRYERWILPIIVMFPALMVVTFAPYIFKMFGWYQ
ncbi:TRAP transporter large permease subunit [Alkanindiges sp. WGS2144]|uniref:TRAP transporter large permease subunit n=1 Tax=Alkanindiges sp. WGS2144 TaxID=3366808 RepID=UPI0037516D5A